MVAEGCAEVKIQLLKQGIGPLPARQGASLRAARPRIGPRAEGDQGSAGFGRCSCPPERRSAPLVETAFSIEPQAGVRNRRELRLKLERHWKAENLGVAAFLQDPVSMRIYAAAARPLFAPAPQN